MTEQSNTKETKPVIETTVTVTPPTNGVKVIETPDNKSEGKTTDSVSFKKVPVIENAPTSKKEVPVKKSGEKKNTFDEDALVKKLTKNFEKTVQGSAANTDTDGNQTPVRNFSYDTLKDKLGFDFADEDDLASKFKENRSSSGIDSKKIREINNDIRNVERLISLSDTELLEQKLIHVDGLKPETAKKRVQIILDRDGDDEVSYQSEMFRNQATSWLDGLNKELDKTLDSSQNNGENISKLFESLEKDKDILGVPRETFDEEISMLKNKNYKSLTDILPKDQLARAILIGQNLDKFKSVIEESAFTRGFNRGWKQVEDKLLNKAPAQESMKGRQYVPNDVKKPDLDRVDSFLKSKRGV